MDQVIPHCSRSLTPAKQKTEFSAAADEDEIRWKKLKEETLALFMEDDLPSDVKSEDDLLSEIHKAEDSEDEETPEAYDDDRPPIKIWVAEGWVEDVSEYGNDKDDTVYDDEEEEDYVFANEEEKKNFKLYAQEYPRSEGFDIEYFCNKVMNALMPLNLNQEDQYLVTRDCKKSVEAAIKYKNVMNNWNLELVKLIKSNYITGSVYYATFDAKDNGVTRTCQAKLGRDHFTPMTTIDKFRVKSEPKH